jgi:hypothetical protein
LAFYDGIVEALRRVREAIARRIMPPKVVTVYSYVVRASGYAEPPREMQRKKRYKRETLIQFELSFEESPYFRTLTADHKEAEKTFGDALKDLVADQEIVAFRKRAIYASLIKAEEIPEETLQSYLRGASVEEKTRYKEEKKIFMPKGKSTFVVTAIDFEPIEMIEVPEDRIPERRASDIFYFKLYRPNEEEEFDLWRGEWIHDL